MNANFENILLFFFFAFIKDFNNIRLTFLINILVVGSVYGLLYSIILAISHRKAFGKELRKLLGVKEFKKTRNIVYIFSALLLVISFFMQDSFAQLLLYVIIALFISVVYVWIFVKGVENACMILAVEPSRLTEGDWIYKPIKYEGKVIASPKDLGVSKKQIAALVKLYSQKKINKVWMKQGIPFVPSFLIAFVLTLIVGNLFLFFAGAPLF